MTLRDLRRSCASTTATIREAMTVVDRSGSAVCLLVDDAQHLVGVLTDGDLRRALLHGAALDSPAIEHATRSPQTVARGSSRALVLDLMRALGMTVVPEVDDDGVLVGLHTLSDVVGAAPLPNTAVIMAGGRGTRLGPLTRDRPKPLMTVAGRSIIEWIVLNLVGGGVRRVHVSVNYLADQVVEHLGDGSRLGCEITYLREDPDVPLGTAGSLALLREQHGLPTHPMLVMNGDLMVQFEVADLLEAHASQQASMTVATRSYHHQIPFGVVDSDDGVVRGLTEKPTLAAEINTGVYVVEPDLLDLVPAGTPSTMPDLVQACLDTGRRVAAWSLASDWIDVGTPHDLARAKGHT